MAGRALAGLEYRVSIHKRMNIWMGLQWLAYMTMVMDGVPEGMMDLVVYKEYVRTIHQKKKIRDFVPA